MKGNLGGQIACWKQALKNEVKTIKQKYNDLERELEVNNELLKVSQGKYHSFEREFNLLKEDRDSVLQQISTSSEMLTQITAQKERALKDLNAEVRMRKKLEEDIKQFFVAFVSRQRSITSLHTEFKTILETTKAQNPISLSKSHGS